LVAARHQEVAVTELLPPLAALLDWLKSLEACVRYGTKLNASDLPAIEQVRAIVAASVSVPPVPGVDDMARDTDGYIKEASIIAKP
jgi:hypothetical protein